MRNETRLQFNAYLDQVATLNQIPDAAQKFNVDPSVQQTLETKIQESSEFLAKVNIVGVREQSGERLGLGIGTPIASTTDTSVQDRTTRDPSTLDARDYRCTQTNSDTHITYQKLDAWAKFPDFQTRIRNAIVAQQARDRILIGFNGVQRAVTSDLANHPLLQDVNIGWLQKYRTHAPQRVLKDGATAGKIVIGEGAGKDYRNLDALVFDAVNSLLEPWYQDDTALVAICGRDLLYSKLSSIINAIPNTAPSERLAGDVLISQRRLGNLPALRVPFMPAKTLFITRCDNLSIYWQEGARRRAVTDNPKRDRIENWESSNDAYVIEDYGCGCLIENIEIAD